MTLSEAIEEVRDYCSWSAVWTELDITKTNWSHGPDVPTAIATILNAVVKGELK